MGPLKPQLSLYGKVFVMRLTLVLVKPPTGYETEFLLRVDAGEVGLLALAVILGVLPRFRRLGLKLVAEVPVQQVSVVAVRVCSRASAQLSRRRRQTACDDDGMQTDLGVRLAWGSGRPSSHRCSPAS